MRVKKALIDLAKNISGHFLFRIGMHLLSLAVIYAAILQYNKYVKLDELPSFEHYLLRITEYISLTVIFFGFLGDDIEKGIGIDIVSPIKKRFGFKPILCEKENCCKNSKTGFCKEKRIEINSLAICTTCVIEQLTTVER